MFFGEPYVTVAEKKGRAAKKDEIDFKCSCPDHAYMCKHVAAVLYGVGSRLDAEPDKLFLLRQVNSLELINAATSSEKFKTAVTSPSMDDESISSLFGIEIDMQDTDKKALKTQPKGKKKTALKKASKEAPKKKSKQKARPKPVTKAKTSSKKLKKTKKILM